MDSHVNLPELLARRLDGSLEAIGSLRPLLPLIHTAAQRLIECWRSGGTVYTCGNGGSAAQAMHLAEELIGRYRSNRAALRAVCLNADPTALTCIANDFGFDRVFSRQCEALLTPADVLVVLSTSGKSSNILNALSTAQERDTFALGILGKDGGAAAGKCDCAIIVPGGDSAFIQDAHQVIIHLLCEVAEAAFSSR